MSWTETRAAVTLEEVRAAEPTPGLGAERPQNQPLFAAAIAAAAGIIETGTAGPPDGRFNLTLYGHVADADRAYSSVGCSIFQAVPPREASAA